jgi:hypothetical protein
LKAQSFSARPIVARQKAGGARNGRSVADLTSRARGDQAQGADVVEFRSIAKFLGAYGAGVVTAGFFLSAPIERPGLLRHAPDFDPPNATSMDWVLVPPAKPFAAPLRNPARRDRFDTQEPGDANVAKPPEAATATTGSASGATQNANVYDHDASSAARNQIENQCNYAACRRAYQSFDEATCTYQPYGGLRQRCTR